MLSAAVINPSPTPQIVTEETIVTTETEQVRPIVLNTNMALQHILIIVSMWTHRRPSFL